MAFISATPVLASPRLSSARCALRPVSSFAGARLTARPVPASSIVCIPRMGFEISEGVEFNVDISILALAIIGWIVPSSLPAGIPLTEGTGLSQAFFASMNANLANWPKGPAADDPFWTLCFLWHIGLFACMIFGTIGVNWRKAKEAGKW